jgi:hypothetical protein
LILRDWERGPLCCLNWSKDEGKQSKRDEQWDIELEVEDQIILAECKEDPDQRVEEADEKGFNKLDLIVADRR